MILGTIDNLPVSAPQISAVPTILDKYREYAGNINLTADDLYAFLTKPTDSREAFLQQLQHQAAIESNRFISQSFE